MRDLLLDRHRDSMTRVLDLGRDLVWHFCRARPVFLRIFEDAEPFKSSAFDKLEQRLELRVSLAGESNDEGRAQGEAGNAGAQFVDQILNMMA